MVEIIVSIISSVFTFAGVVITVISTNKKTAQTLNEQHDNLTHELYRQQAVFDARLEELTREVREHNGFARRMPVVEEQIKVINHRLEDIERKAD